MSLEGRVILITGGRRVGHALAQTLAGQGASVALTYRKSRDVIEQAVAEIERAGGKALAVGANLAQSSEAEQAVAKVVDHFGRIDALVNMASTFRRTFFAALTSDDFDAMIADNLAGPYHTAVAAGKQMLKQHDVDGIRGRIINIGDWATERPYKDFLPYLVAKGALTTFTLALAKELAPHVPVALIQPAMIDPPPDMTEAEIEAIVRQTPLARVGTPDDVNRLILYLLDGTQFVTGACFRVDGGRFLGTDT
jgi:NAD(P)-dependent dehydrogenase (short-subunit alcohol dehydrogenase family)